MAISPAAADAERAGVTSIAGIPFNDIGFAATVERIVGWARDRSYGYVCTPNVDYIVRARREPDFRLALLDARLRVPDGMGVIYGSRLTGRPLARSVTGRLLPPAVVAAVRADPLPIAVFGGRAGVAHRAAAALERRGAVIADAFGPPMGFRVGSDDDARATARLAASGARIVFVGLGAPRQELWMRRVHTELESVLVGVGAGVDVLAGEVREAPPWMTRVGLEWLFRLAQEPRRLGRRYLVDDPRFFWWMLRARWAPELHHPMRPSST